MNFIKNGAFEVKTVKTLSWHEIEQVSFTAKKNSNQIQCFVTICITPKRVTSWRGPSQRHCAQQAAQLISKKCCNGGKPSTTQCSI